MRRTRRYRAAGSGLAIGIACAVSVGAAPVARADQVQILVNYGGYDGCNVCGVADYTVPGLPLWNDGLATFTDPVPAGAIVTQMTASLHGTGDADATVTVNGTALGTSSIVGSSGLCDTCYDGTAATSADYPAGFPGYVAGGVNTMQLTTASTGLALDAVTLTITYLACGDGNVAPSEQCDTAGESATCDADCTLVVCGDGHVNGAAGEACDVSVENPACDADCTLAECGDEHVNATAGEACDDGNTADGDGCSALCQVEEGTSSTSGTAGGDEATSSTSGVGGDGGAGAGGPSGPTAGPSAANGPGSGAGGDDDASGGASDEGDGDDAASGTGGEAAGSDSDGGCGCTVPQGPRTPLSVVVGLGVLVVALRRGRRGRG